MIGAGTGVRLEGFVFCAGGIAPAFACWSRSRTITRIHSAAPTGRCASRPEWFVHDRGTEDGDKAFAEASVVGRKHVTQPVERLHKAHSRTARPIEAAGCGGLKVEG